MAIKLEVGATPASSFKLDGLDYPNGLHEIIYGNRESDSSGNVVEATIKIGLRNRNNKEILVSPRLIKDWVNDLDTPYATLAALMLDISRLVFKSASGSSGALVLSQHVANYSNLLNGTSLGDLAYVDNSQGVAWLPGTLGGSYYPAGLYFWNSASWVSDRNAIAEALFKQSQATKEIKTVVNNYLILETDYSILADATSNAVTVTLPLAPNNGRVYNVKCINDTFTCTVAGNGKNIDGVLADKTLVSPNSLTLQFTSTYGWALI